MLRMGTGRMHPKMVTMDTSEQFGGQGFEQRAGEGDYQGLCCIFYIVWVFFLEEYIHLLPSNLKRNNDIEGGICSLRSLRGEFTTSLWVSHIVGMWNVGMCIVSIFLKIWSIAFIIFPKRTTALYLPIWRAFLYMSQVRSSLLRS